MTTGFTCFKKEILAKINVDQIASEGYAFLVAFKHLTYRAGYRIMEFPITYKERRAGTSKMSWHVIWESMKLPWILRR